MPLIDLWVDGDAINVPEVTQFVAGVKEGNHQMRSITTQLLRLLALLLAFVLVAAACSSDDSDDEATGSEGETEEGATEGDAADNPADDSLDPLKIGLISQDEELIAFPEVRASAEAFADYFNAEEAGADGHPIEVVACGAGDAPESHVSCAQEFVNDDSINVVIAGGFGPNSAAASAVLTEAGVPTLTLGNDFVDYLTPGSYTFDPGLPGLAQVFFVFMSQTRGDETATLFIADDPAFEPFIPALEAIGDANGVAVNEVVPLGFEPDLTGPISAANTENDAWLFVLADGSQCTAAASAAATVGYEGNLYANDLCTSEDVVSAGDLDGWSSAIVSSAPTTDGGEGVDLINRVLATYAEGDVQNAGLTGWAVANTYVARDLLTKSGGADATRESVLASLEDYSISGVPGMPETMSCPGPSVWTGACDMAPLMVAIDGGELTSPDGFVQLDFSELDFLLEG